MQLFGDIVKSILNEGENKVDFNYDSIPNSNFVNGPVYVYHMTNESNLSGGILKTGWESYYNLVNSYGHGIYTTIYPSFDPRANVKDEQGRPNPTLDWDGGTSHYMARRFIYGQKDNGGGGRKPAVMIACKTKKSHPFHSFIIFDEKIAKEIYRSHWEFRNQLKLILGDKLYDEIRKYKGTIIDQISMLSYRKMYERGEAAYLVEKYLCNDVEVNKKIKGLIFHGPGDGFVAIFRDYNALEPFAISYDCGHTFKKIEVEETFEEYNNNNVDVRSALGLDRFFFPKLDTIKPEYWDILKNIPFKYISSILFGDYGIVGTTNNPKQERIIIGGRGYQCITTQNRKDWKWNYLYKPLINNGDDYMNMTVSPNIWFDEISNKWNKNTAVVMKDNKLYTIYNKNGNFYLYDEHGNDIGNLKELTDNDLIQYNNTTINKKKEDKIGNNNDDKTIVQNQEIDKSNNEIEPIEKRVRPKRKFGLRK